MDVIALARELVAIPSVTGEEGEVGAFVARRLEAAGWHVTRQELPPVAGTTPKHPRINVLARTEREGHPRVVLTTHLDTVPPFFPSSEDAEFLHGRGSCDAKGIFAAQWVAAERLRSAGHQGVALLGVVGEETDSVGAKSVAEILPKADFLIDGEPTDLLLARAAKGVLVLELTTEGVAAHSAYPERGRSAITPLVAALARLALSKLPFEERFGETTVNVGLVAGGVAPNVLAPSARASLMVRLGADPELVLSEIRKILGEDVGVRVISKSAPHEICVPGARESLVVRFGSDVPHLVAIGTPLLVGPGSIHDAHTAHERISKRELVDAVELYFDLAVGLIGATPPR